MTRKSTIRFPYDEFAERYNERDPGAKFKLNGFSNLANFKDGMSRRNLEDGVDYKAFQRRKYCFLTKLTNKTMRG